MTEDPRTRRSPGWILVVIGAGFLVLAVGVVLKIGLEELPPGARPEEIEKRFEAQIRFLRDLATTYPATECGAVHPVEGDLEEVTAFVEQLRDRGEWKKHVEESADLFSEPVILGASMVCYQLDRTITLDLKSFDEPPSALSRAMLFPRNRQPKVSLWYAGEKRFIKYEDKVGESSENMKGFELFLDADRLEIEPEKKSP